MRTTKVISLFLSVFLVLGLVSGCAGNQGKTPTQDGTKKGVKLTVFAYTADVNTPGFQKLLDDYSKESGNTVEFNVIPGDVDEAYKKIDVALMTGDKTDLIFMKSPKTDQHYVSSGSLLPLNDLAKKAGYDYDALFGSKVSKIGDVAYSLPLAATYWGVLYNKKIFDDAGVPYPNASWTWDDYIATGDKLSDPSKGIYGSIMPTYDTMLYFKATTQNVPGYKADGTSNLDDPAFADALKWFNDLSAVHHIQMSFPETALKKLTAREFLKGKIGMSFVSSWIYRDMVNVKDYPRDWKVGLVQTPVFKDSSVNNNMFSYNTMGINKNSEHPEAAFDFLKYATNHFYLETKAFPPNQKFDEATMRPQFQAMSDSLNGDITVEDFKNAYFDNNMGAAQEKIFGPAMTQISDIYKQEGQMYMSGKQDLATTMKNIKKRADDAIADEAKGTGK